MRKFLVIILMYVFVPIFGQDYDVVVPPQSPAILASETLTETDSILKTNYQTDNTVTTRKFSPNYYKKYQGEDFDYRLTKPRESIFAKFLKWLDKALNTLFGNVDTPNTFKYTEIIIKLSVILLVGFLLYFIITKLFLKEGNIIFSKKNKKLKIVTEDLHENIHDINFEKTIAEYEANSNYRMATRYQFLSLLKKLSDRKLIDWNIEKTNRDYCRELKNDDQKTQLNRLTYIFENVWYGEIE
ncbi:MAG: DUF4129 domain-containing protein, partial [Soonwooa sp.]